MVRKVVDCWGWYVGFGVGVVAICGLGRVGGYGGWGIWCVVAMVVDCRVGGCVVFWVDIMVIYRLPSGVLAQYMWTCGPAISYFLVVIPSRLHS